MLVSRRIVSACLFFLISAPSSTFEYAQTSADLQQRDALLSRIRPPSEQVISVLKESGLDEASDHPLTEAEKSQLLSAFALLPPLEQEVLARNLHSISFVDGMPNNALTSVVESDGTDKSFDLTIRAGVLKETVSELVTAKERTLFDPDASGLSISVDAGTMDAIVYVLAHEAAHMVDARFGITPSAGSPPTKFTSGVWIDRMTLAAPFSKGILSGLKYRRGGATKPASEAEDVLKALEGTPFVSLYGSSNWADDFAELAAWNHIVHFLKQPYKLQIWKGGEPVREYEPLTSPAVQQRLSQLDVLYRSTSD